MSDRIVLNPISYHGHGAIENIVPELTARGSTVTVYFSLLFCFIFEKTKLILFVPAFKPLYLKYLAFNSIIFTIVLL